MIASYLVGSSFGNGISDGTRKAAAGSWHYLGALTAAHVAIFFRMRQPSRF
jgi:hypothetical protein